jgi:hypothetical protein
VPGWAAPLEGQADMNGSHLSRIVAPIVTTIFLAARLISVAYAASRPRWRAHYIPRHERPRKATPPARIIIATAGNEPFLAGDAR